MAGMLRRALAGAGAAMEDAGSRWLQSTLDKERQEYLTNLTARHQQMAQERGYVHAEKMQAGQQDFQRVENAATRKVTQEEGALTRQHQSTESAATRTHQAAEGNATRELQRSLAEAHEKSANTRHAQSIGVQLAQLKAVNEQVTLVPQADGTIQKMGKDGRPMGTLTDLSGNPIIGPKDVSASAKILIEGNNNIIKALAADLDKAVTPEEKQQINGRMESLRQENRSLAGLKPDGGASPSGQPSPGDIDGLKKRAGNPAAVAAFEAKYGQGSAQQYLPKSAPAAPTVEQPRGYAQTLDAVSPRPQRGLIRQEIEDQSPFTQYP